MLCTGVVVGVVVEVEVCGYRWWRCLVSGGEVCDVGGGLRVVVVVVKG